MFKGVYLTENGITQTIDPSTTKKSGPKYDGGKYKYF